MVLPAPLQPMMTVKVGGAVMAYGTPVAGRSVVARFRGPLCRWWEGDMLVVRLHRQAHELRLVQAFGARDGRDRCTGPSGSGASMQTQVV